MIRVEIDETIDRPIEEVFDQLVDIDRYPDWMPESSILVTCSKNSEGPVTVGTEYTDMTRFGTARGEVQALVPPRKILFHYVVRLLGVPVMEGWPGYTLEPAGQGATKLHHLAEGRLRGPFKLIRPVIRRIARRERRRTVEALKHSLETSSDQ